MTYIVGIDVEFCRHLSECFCYRYYYYYYYCSNQEQWKRGLTKAEGQNLARRLMESPANRMTPTRFAEIATEVLSTKGVKVNVR